MFPRGISPLTTQQRFSLQSHSPQSTPRRTGLFHSPAPAPGPMQATPRLPAPAATPPAASPAAVAGPQGPPLPPVVGYSQACPPSLYVLKDKICPYRHVDDGCSYRTHIQNLLTRHVRRTHNPDYRQQYRRRQAPRPRVIPDDEDEQEPAAPATPQYPPAAAAAADEIAGSPRHRRPPANHPEQTPTRTHTRSTQVNHNTSLQVNDTPPSAGHSNNTIDLAGHNNTLPPALSLSQSSEQAPLEHMDTSEPSPLPAPRLALTHHLPSTPQPLALTHAPSPLPAPRLALTHQLSTPRPLALTHQLSTPQPAPLAITHQPSPAPLALTRQTVDDPSSPFPPPEAASTPTTAARTGPHEIVLSGQPQPEAYDYDERDLRQTTKIRSAQLSKDFTMMVCGPSNAGKTMFVAQLINHRATLCERPPVHIVVVYCNPDPKLTRYADTKINVNEINKQQYTQEHLKRIFIKAATQGAEIGKAAPSLLVFDDCQNKKEVVGVIADLFMGGARHQNISVIYVAQTLYSGHDQHQISANSKYLTLFKNNRFKNEITTLNTQILPGQPGIIAAMLEELDAHEHLLINVMANRDNLSTKYMANIFHTNHVIPVFVAPKPNHL